MLFDLFPTCIIHLYVLFCFIHLFVVCNSGGISDPGDGQIPANLLPSPQPDIIDGRPLCRVVSDWSDHDNECKLNISVNFVLHCIL